MDQAQAQTLAKNFLTNEKWNHFVDSFASDPIDGGFFSGATFELTAFCTLKCPMCYVRIDKDQANSLGGKLRTAKEWIDMGRQFRDQGGIFLLITGGEPIMRPDFQEIYEEISRLGLFVTLFTNGTTVDDRILDMLRKRPPAMVGLTLYGSSEETYRRFGGSEGSFQRAVDGLDRLLTIPNLNVEVRFTACAENYMDFEGVADLAASRDKFIALDFGILAPVRGASSDTRKLRLTQPQHDEINEISQRISAPILEEYKKIAGDKSLGGKLLKKADLLTKEQKPPETRSLWCKGGRNLVYIAWDGRMYPCDMASYPFSFPFEQGFYDAALDIRRQIETLIYPERCMTCVNKDTFCSCVPKAQNEMRDAARRGERCNYVPRNS